VLDGEDRAVVGGQRSSRQPPWPGLVAASCQQTIHGNVSIQQRLSRLSKVVQGRAPSRPKPSIRRLPNGSEAGRTYRSMCRLKQPAPSDHRGGARSGGRKPTHAAVSVA